MNSEIKTLYNFEQNMRLIDLASDCGFLNSSEKTTTIKLLEENSKEDSNTNVIDIFKQESFISDKRVEYLLAFDAHLQLHYKDQQFGRIATANSMASKKDVDNALKYQKDYFKKNLTNIKIGDILIENGGITKATQVSILITQNRIKDENLLDALNDMGETQRQKDAINRRVGALAIRNELITKELVNAALEIQKSEKKRSGKTRFIGDILQETANLSDNDILQILLDQKQFEKRRLDLEKALYTVKSELKISKKLNKLFKYNISKDRLEAFVKKLIEIDEEIPVYDFLVWLRRAGIKFGIVDDDVLEEFIQKAEKNSKILVAKGYTAKQCTDESIQLYEVTSDKSDNNQDNNNQDNNNQDNNNQDNNNQDNNNQDNNNQDNNDEKEVKNNEPLLIKRGHLLAKIIPGKEGKPGKDIFGYPILPEQPSIYIINAGSGVIKKDSIFFARIDGYPVLKNGNTLMVESVVKKTEIKTIVNNISCDTKDNYESLIVEMTGTITSEAVFRCRSLLLYGSLLGCVISTGKIDIKGDIGTDKKLKDQEAIHQANITCQESVKVSKSIINSTIQTAGELLASNSTVIGSQVIAFKGMTIQNVIKCKQTSSTLWFGIKPGDKILDLDHTLEMKNRDLYILQKTDEITQLKEKYRDDLKEGSHQFEQVILKNLVEIIEAPELYQYEGLEAKIKYLYGLPDFSSIKAYYLKLPETDAALASLDQIVTSTEKMSLEDVLKYIKERVEPEPEGEGEGESEGESEGEGKGENAISNTNRIETDFKTRLSIFEQEIVEKSEEIEKIENEIKGLYALREKFGLINANSLPESRSVINIKNKCEKGTIIKGTIAQHVIEKTVYNVIFKEIIDPITNAATISIETY